MSEKERSCTNCIHIGVCKVLHDFSVVMNYTTTRASMVADGTYARVSAGIFKALGGCDEWLGREEADDNRSISTE